MVKQIKSKHHFVPQFILKKFLKATSYQMFDVKQGKYYPKGASNSMYKRFYYEHEDFEVNEIENLLSTRENLYAPLLERLLPQTQLLPEEYRLLIEFRHVSYYRSNEFFGFHTFGTNRGKSSRLQRADWRMINGIYATDAIDHRSAIKRSQLRSIKRVIDGEDEAFRLSLMTPVCFVFHTKSLKFIIGDSGGVSLGEDEFHGMRVVAISPELALGFPRLISATEIMQKIGATRTTPHIIYEEIEGSVVKIVNDAMISHAYEFYIDPNL